MYADYAFYAAAYRGRLPAEEFERLAVRAAAYVDMITFGRAAQAAGETLRRVKLAECAAVDVMAIEEQGGPVVSETAGRYTVTRAGGGRSPAQRLRRAVTPYLSGTGLLFPGV